MNLHRYLKLRYFGAAVMTVVAACQTVSGAEMSLPSQVVRFRGAARYTPAGKSWRMVKPKDVFLPGSMIQTSIDESGFLDIVLGETVQPSSFQEEMRVVNFVHLWGSSILRIDELASAGDSGHNLTAGLFLLGGKMTAYVAGLPRGSTFAVGLTNGIAHPREDSWFELTCAGELRVLTGAVTLKLKDRKAPVEIAAGHMFTPSTGLTTEIPTDGYDNWRPKLPVAPPQAAPHQSTSYRPVVPARSF